MDSYVERRLVGLHNAGAEVQMKQKVITFFLGAATVFLLPYIHIGVFYWYWSEKGEVDRASCQCSCYDTVFRGVYEWPPSGYKHVYFNSTRQTLMIWLLIILGAFGVYECVRYVAPLIWKKKVRISMLALLISSLYPHYYGWWGFFNYLNEDFYPQWWHQVFFSFTELLSTFVVIHLCNKDNKVDSWKLLAIFNINLMHILVNSLDQFVNNVIYRRAQHFEVVRDFGLMIPDVFHVLVAYFEIMDLAKKRQVSVFRLFYREELLASLVLVSMFSILGKNI